MLADSFEALEIPAEYSATLESLHLIGLSYRTAGLELRSALSFAGEKREALFRGLSALGIEQALVLSTCNRTEVCFCGGDIDVVSDLLCRFSGLDRETLDTHTYRYTATVVAEHLCRVASGLESAALGETEILAQIKEAWRAASDAAMMGGTIDLLCRSALETSKRVRTETELCRNVTSLASMAVRQAALVGGPLKDRNILLLGAGAIGERLAKEIYAVHGARCTIANRTEAKAAALASRYGFESASLSDLDGLLAAHTIIFCAVMSETPLITEKMIRAGQVIVDLGVPSIVQAPTLQNAHIINMEFLASACAANTEIRAKAVADAEEIIACSVAAFARECCDRDVAPAIRAMMCLGEEVKREQLAWALASLPNLSPEERKIVQDLAYRIVRGVLQPTIAAMKDAHHTGKERMMVAAVLGQVGPKAVQD